MSTSYPTLMRSDLRAVLEAGPFAPSERGYSFESEVLVRRDNAGAVVPAWDDDVEQLGAVRAALATLEGLSIAARGVARIQSVEHESPVGAFESFALRSQALAERVAAWGMELVACGSDPWAAQGRSLDAVLRVPFGSPASAPQRWAAAQALAPLSEAIFACSPLREQSSQGARSLGAAQRRAERTRGFMRTDSTATLERFLDWALEAPVREERSFREWFERGENGRWPDRADFAAHVASLRAHVLPAGGLSLRAFDAPPFEFACVPLIWWSVLLDDTACLRELSQWAPPTVARLEVASNAALTDPELAAQARRSFALVAERLLDRPGRYATPQMLASFVAFAERFALRGRTPADEWLARFARRGRFSLSDWVELRAHWRAASLARSAA